MFVYLYVSSSLFHVMCYCCCSLLIFGLVPSRDPCPLVFMISLVSVCFNVCFHHMYIYIYMYMHICLLSFCFVFSVGSLAGP